MDTLALVAALVVMGAIISGMVALYQSTASPRSGLERRLGTLLTSGGGFDLPDLAALRPRRTGRVPIISSFLEGRNSTEEMGLRLERADLKLTVSEFVALRIFMAFFGGVLPLFFLGGGPLGMAAMAGAALVGFILPAMYVSFATGRRLGKLQKQLVEGLSLVSNSLKAGFGLMQSLDLASKELQHPLATELRRMLYDVNVGASIEDAFLSLAKRSGSPDLDIVITAMLIQQSTGGNLAEILDNTSHTMRERIRIQGEIKTLTTQQVMTGFIIGGLPFFMMGMFSLINPAYMAPLFTTTAGNAMLVAGGIMELFGILVIKKILVIEV